MAKETDWEVRRILCPEGERDATLLIEWEEEGGKRVVKSLSCDNPKLGDLDNWDCKWSCWDKICKQKT